MRNTERPPLAQLDGLRAIAVVLVLVQHFAPRAAWIDAVGPGGLGVALFFVLSGYLLTGILIDHAPRHGEPSWPTLKVFYARRALRILPLYWLVLLVTAALDVGPARRALAYNALYLSNVYFFVRGAWDGPISPLWSLAVEEQFYLLWPVAALAFARRSTRSIARFALGLALCGPLFRLCFLWKFGANPFALLLPLGYTDQLAWGGALAAFEREPALARRVAQVRRAALLVALPWLALSMARAAPAQSSIEWVLLWALRPTAVALVAWALVSRAIEGFGGPVGRALASRPLGHVGKVSYGVYLLHPYLHFTAFSLCLVPGLRWTRPALEWLRSDGWRWLPIACATAIVGASLSWALFERPINDRKKRLRYPR